MTWVADLLAGGRNLPSLYAEGRRAAASDYDEASPALSGEAPRRCASHADGGHGAERRRAGAALRAGARRAACSRPTGDDIDEAVRDVRLDVLKVFGVALAVTMLLSLYLAGTIARPMRACRGRRPGAPRPAAAAGRSPIYSRAATRSAICRARCAT